ncbi:hypothetical protein GUJ93_ZPchr0001g29972 [Zizania palustris]|uniref:Uncharacterized protein n=1 Tax=Zizania palustris TaxID=103762 RepID=A0A8J5SEG8_ZIZPA|nr:hypothetical protein GUJ93_ZPchr0001g29972 [Zizania palustris]
MASSLQAFTSLMHLILQVQVCSHIVSCISISAVTVEAPFICNHLQEEHCFDTTNAVCPLCVESIGKDMSAHFRVQHSHLLKRRKSSRPSSSWPTNNSDPPHPHYMMSSQDLAPDPLLSQFICSMAQTDANSNNSKTEIAFSPISDEQRLRQPVAGDASNKLELKEGLQRIEFLKEILMSTIL